MYDCRGEGCNFLKNHRDQANSITVAEGFKQNVPTTIGQADKRLTSFIESSILNFQMNQAKLQRQNQHAKGHVIIEFSHYVGGLGRFFLLLW